MLRNTFLRTLYEQWRGIIWWSVGLISYCLVMALFYPSIRSARVALEQYMQAMPEGFRAAFMGEIADISSPEGYLTAEIFSFMMPIMVLVYAIGVGSNAIAGEEERGTLDLLLANPIGRARIVLEKGAALLVSTTALMFFLFIGLVLGAGAGDMHIGWWPLARGALALGLLAIAFGYLALGIGATTGSKGLARSVSAIVATGAYVLNAFAPTVQQLQPYQRLSLFYYYIGKNPLVQGIDPLHAGVLLLCAALCLIAGLAAFERRDLAV
jgi:ABC-2 type transport system permease protein